MTSHRKLCGAHVVPVDRIADLAMGLDGACYRHGIRSRISSLAGELAGRVVGSRAGCNASFCPALAQLEANIARTTAASGNLAATINGHRVDRFGPQNSSAIQRPDPFIGLSDNAPSDKMRETALHILGKCTSKFDYRCKQQLTLHWRNR
jgi:hypothetical protein